MDTVFDHFQETAYTFLQLNQGGVKGNVSAVEYPAMGVLKSRQGMTQNQNRETIQSDSTLHIHPDEPFISVLLASAKDKDNFLTGHGIAAEKNGYAQTYRITGHAEGYNYDTNELEFYRLTLKSEKLAVA